MSLKIFLSYLIKLWVFSAGVSFHTGTLIVSPGAWLELSGNTKYCLMYKAPLKKEHKGELAIFHRKADAACNDVIITEPLSSIEIEGKPSLMGDLQKLELSFKYKDKLEKINLPLWGAKVDSLRNAFVGESRAKHMTFLDPESECIDHECRKCPRGFMHISSTDGIKRICHDPSECGGANQPACYLGSDWGSSKENCDPKSGAGWCEQGLSLTCSSVTNYLVCE